MAGPVNINFGTAPNASTFTSDIGSPTRLATSAPFARYLTEAIYESSLMVQSGLLQTDARLNNITGVIVEMPFFAPLNYSEELVNSSATWGDNGKGYYTTQKQTASTQFAPMVSRGAAFAMDDLSQVQTGEDALANIRSQLARDMNRKITSKIISQITGLMDTALASHVVDVGIVDADGTGLTDANYLSAATVTKGKAVLGERGQDLKVLVVHPDVAYHMEALGMLTFLNSGGTVNYASNGIGVTDTQIGYFAGLRVVIDSQVPVTADAGTGKYSCYLAAPGVIRTGSQFPLQIETERNILSLQDVMAVTYNRCDHCIGTSWVGSTTDPTNANLATGSNWEAAYSDTRLIPLVELVVNTPYGVINP